MTGEELRKSELMSSKKCFARKLDIGSTGSDGQIINGLQMSSAFSTFLGFCPKLWQ